MYYPNQFFYPYTIYSPQQCVCQNLPSCAIYTPGSYYAGVGASGYIGDSGAGFCVTFNSLDSRMNKYCSKKESWIEKMDKLIFPNDPIRDWVENEVERISRKYAWTDQF